MAKRAPRVTREQIARILEMQQDGRPYKEIAAELNISDKTVGTVCLKNGIRRKKSPQNGDTLTCPKCKRGGLPRIYHYCPYCAADVRTEKNKLIDLLERTAELFTPPHATEKDSKAHYAFQRAIAYLEVLKDA